MKIIAIGDLHGRDCWKEFLNQDFDEAIFLGDYFDSHTLSREKQYLNFRDLLDVAKKDSRIKLCKGNHDMHYTKNYPTYEKYSGYDGRNYAMFSNLLEEADEYMNLIYIRSNYIFSHAGVTQTWLDNNNIKLEEVNERFKKVPEICLFDGINIYGDDITQSPVWIRPNSLLADGVDGYVQVVGHTAVLDISCVENIIMCDCLDNKKTCLTLTI